MSSDNGWVWMREWAMRKTYYYIFIYKCIRHTYVPTYTYKYCSFRWLNIALGRCFILTLKSNCEFMTCTIHKLTHSCTRSESAIYRRNKWKKAVTTTTTRNVGGFTVELNVHLPKKISFSWIQIIFWLVWILFGTFSFYTDLKLKVR